MHAYAATSAPKVIRAGRIDTPPKIDGVLDDACWQGAEAASNFSQLEPYNGSPASFPSEVYLTYDDKALYLGAMLHDPAPDSILTQLSKRDGGGAANADFFVLGLDTYNDNLNAFVFAVSAAGVQTDTRYSPIGEDVVWDAVWRSEVKINEKGWVIEMEIPFSAIRFSGKDVQDWGIQFRRTIRRKRETSYWNPVDRKVEGWVNQFGNAEGVKGIKPPLRLAVTPYVSGYLEHHSAGNGGASSSTQRYFNAGADLKMGISESFTLDLTLVPDFGQVVADNQVLNLSPFEVQFKENRQFFTEGTELFNIANIFYSRRVGGVPRNFDAAMDSLQAGEELVENPGKTKLINAFKLSGRTSGKTGLAVFNGMTAPAYATAISETGERGILTQAFTNYNVAVVDQALKNNSYVSLINTNRLETNGYIDNVTAGRFRLSDADNKYFVSGSGALSQQWVPGSRTPGLGHSFNYALGKASGNLVFELGQVIESEDYDPTGMGFLQSNNELTDFGSISYRRFKPIWKFVSIINNLSFNHNSLYQPHRYANLDISYDNWFQMKSFDFFGTWWWVNPLGGFDFFEPRVMGRQVAYTAGGGAGGFVSTNYARRFALDLEVDLWGRPEMKMLTEYYSIAPRVRVSDRFAIIHTLNLWKSANQYGFVNFDSLGQSLIGTRTRRDIENVLNLDYTFTNKMAFSFRARHVWSGVHYHKISVLSGEGLMEPTSYNENHDINFNVFNIDAVFQWRFAPGSDIFVVWKRNVLTYASRPDYNYFRNLDGTFTAPQVNSISVRVLYYLDLGRMLKRNGGAEDSMGLLGQKRPFFPRSRGGALHSGFRPGMDFGL